MGREPQCFLGKSGWTWWAYVQQDQAGSEWLFVERRVGTRLQSTWHRHPADIEGLISDVDVPPCDLHQLRTLMQEATDA